MVAESERLRKNLELIITPDVIEVFSPLFDGSGGANVYAGAARAAAFRQGGIRSKGKVCKNGQETNPCAVTLGDKKIVPTDPPDSRCLRDVLMGEVRSLSFPVDELRCGYGHSPISQILNGLRQDEAQSIEENIDPLVMVKVERSRFVFNVIQDGVGEVIPDRNRTGMLIKDSGGEKDLLC
jgi:hypothetical protein